MKTQPRVLLLSATSGAGHVRAAEALEKGFLARGDCVVEHIDALPKGEPPREPGKIVKAIVGKAE